MPFDPGNVEDTYLGLEGAALEIKNPLFSRASRAKEMLETNGGFVRASVRWFAVVKTVHDAPC